MRYIHEITFEIVYSIAKPLFFSHVMSHEIVAETPKGYIFSVSDDQEEYVKKASLEEVIIDSSNQKRIVARYYSLDAQNAYLAMNLTRSMAIIGLEAERDRLNAVIDEVHLSDILTNFSINSMDIEPKNWDESVTSTGENYVFIMRKNMSGSGGCFGYSLIVVLPLEKALEWRCIYDEKSYIILKHPEDKKPLYMWDNMKNEWCKF